MHIAEWLGISPELFGIKTAPKIEAVVQTVDLAYTLQVSEQIQSANIHDPSLGASRTVFPMESRPLVQGMFHGPITVFTDIPLGTMVNPVDLDDAIGRMLEQDLSKR
jgi:hypothetical protein